MKKLIKNIIFIVGPDQSGKTTIQNKLIEEYSARRIISSTTRQPREGEQNGIDYWFLSLEEFKSKEKVQEVKYGENYYGTTMEEYLSDSRSTVGTFVCTPDGIMDTVRSLKAKFPNEKFNYILVYINASEELTNSRGTGERTKRGDIRGDFRKAHEEGQYSSLPILILNDEDLVGEGKSIDTSTETVFNYISAVIGEASEKKLKESSVKNYSLTPKKKKISKAESELLNIIQFASKKIAKGHLNTFISKVCLDKVISIDFESRFLDEESVTQEEKDLILEKIKEFKELRKEGFEDKWETYDVSHLAPAILKAGEIIARNRDLQ